MKKQIMVAYQLSNGIFVYSNFERGKKLVNKKLQANPSKNSPALKPSDLKNSWIENTAKDFPTLPCITSECKS